MKSFAYRLYHGEAEANHLAREWQAIGEHYVKVWQLNGCREDYIFTEEDDDARDRNTGFIEWAAQLDVDDPCFDQATAAFRWRPTLPAAS